jgi:hypothetical protein
LLTERLVHDEQEPADSENKRNAGQKVMNPVRALNKARHQIQKISNG